MANWLEKRLPRRIRNKMSNLIVTAFGLFLALQYNETIKDIFQTFFPLNADNLFGRIIYIILLTFIIVYASTVVERALDGK